MFSTAIQEATLLSQELEAFAPNLHADDYQQDRSFLATARALLPERIPEGESFIIRRNEVFTEDMERKVAYAQSTEHPFLVISDVVMPRDDVRSYFSLLEEGKILPAEYHPLSDVAEFLHQKGVNAKIFIDEGQRRTIVFVEGLSLPRWHLLQSLLPRLAPWYFQEKPLTKEELDLLLSLTKRTKEAYLLAVEALTKKYDIRGLRIRSGLAGFEHRFEEEELQEVLSEIRHADETLRRISDQYSRACRDREAYLTKKVGLEEKIRRSKENGGDSELMDYFLRSKSLYLQSVHGTEITFLVDTVLDDYDPDVFEVTADNPHSYFYQRLSGEMTKKRMEKLLRAVFQEGRIKIHTCAAFRIDSKTVCVTALQSYGYPTEFSGSMPNPHLDGFGCLGNHQMEIQEALRRHDYVMAVGSCVASARNLNFTDSVVGDEFIGALCRNTETLCMELPDGTRATPLDAVLWLEDQEETGKETDHE